MLGWWSDTRLPAIAHDIIVQAFITAPQRRKRDITFWQGGQRPAHLAWAHGL
jgi:hypothetical protein